MRWTNRCENLGTRTRSNRALIGQNGSINLAEDRSSNHDHVWSNVILITDAKMRESSIRDVFRRYRESFSCGYTTLD